MIRKTVKVGLASGLAARPVAILVQIASQYESVIYMEIQDKRVNVKSLMGMMTLKIESGGDIIVTADGRDEEAAVNEIENYLLDKKK